MIRSSVTGLIRFLLEAAKILRETNPDKYLELAYESMKLHVEKMLELQKKGAITFDYGNNIRARAHEKGLKECV